jgi:hypothetical protein
MAAIDGVTYSFRPGDAWQATYETIPDPTNHAHCTGDFKWVQKLTFRNDGFVDESQFPPLSAHTPTPIPPTPTALPGESIKLAPQVSVGRRR